MKLYIFDLDGTLVTDMEFYRKAYSENLDALVLERCGTKGLDLLELTRKTNGGRGELALPALGISYGDWFERITDEDLKFIEPNSKLVEMVTSLVGIKCVYTGSSRALAGKMLTRLGFGKDAFADIIAFENSSLLPAKLTNSPLVFASLLQKFNVSPRDAYAIGDDYETDLHPAEEVGITAIEVRKKSGRAKHYIQDILELPKYLEEIQ